MGDENIIELTKFYRENEDGCFFVLLIIGTDYSGNSIGINREGNVVKYDHDFSEYKILANTFEQYVLDTLK
jgi:hypothetical protein